MSEFKKNPTDFSALCACLDGECTVARENILFLDDGKESAAVTQLQLKCGNVVIMPDPANPKRSLLYLTSCQRMADVIEQIFQSDLQAATGLPQQSEEMSLGEVQRRSVGIPYAECKAKVGAFSF